MRTLQATGDIRKVALWLGHAGTQSTEIYVRADPSEKLEGLVNNNTADFTSRPALGGSFQSKVFGRIPRVNAEGFMHRSPENRSTLRDKA